MRHISMLPGVECEEDVQESIDAGTIWRKSPSLGWGDVTTLNTRDGRTFEISTDERYGYLGVNEIMRGFDKKPLWVKISFYNSFDEAESEEPGVVISEREYGYTTQRYASPKHIIKVLRHSGVIDGNDLPGGYIRKPKTGNR